MIRAPFTAIALAALFCAACSDSNGPSTLQPTLVISPPSPPAGSTIQVTGTLPGAFITRGSGKLSVPISVTAAREVPWAQMYVYLMTGPNANDYCGQNLPDAPTWAPFSKGQMATMTITGFQVFRLPCEVTGFAAYLHTRNTGNLTPPISTDTVASGSMAVSYHLVP
jgi:hypothetical protein